MNQFVAFSGGADSTARGRRQMINHNYPTFATLEDGFAWLNSLPPEITPRVVRLIVPNGKIDYCWKVSAIVYINEKFDHEIEHACVNLLAGLNTFAVILTLEKEAGLL